MKKKYGFMLAVAVLLAGCRTKKRNECYNGRPVKTTIVESRSIIRKDFSGIVEAVEYVKLAFRVSGQIINLPVIEGEKVKKGQLIAAIDPRDIALQYALPNRRMRRLPHKWNAISASSPAKPYRFRNMKSAWLITRKQKSEYELSVNNMRDTKLTAPFQWIPS